MSRATEVRHPYIHRVKNICGGDPVIKGTRFPVRSVAVYVYEHGMTPEDIVRKWKHLNLAQVHDALSYYHDHRDVIDRRIQENREEVVRKRVSG